MATKQIKTKYIIMFSKHKLHRSILCGDALSVRGFYGYDRADPKKNTTHIHNITNRIHVYILTMVQSTPSRNENQLMRMYSCPFFYFGSSFRFIMKSQIKMVYLCCIIVGLQSFDSIGFSSFSLSFCFPSTFLNIWCCAFDCKNIGCRNIWHFVDRCGWIKICSRIIPKLWVCVTERER